MRAKLPWYVCVVWIFVYDVKSVWSNEDNAKLRGLDFGDAPVIEVVMKVAVTDAELEVLQEPIVLVDVESVEHVEVLLFGEDEWISQKLLHFNCVCNVVVAVGDLEGLVSLVLQDWWGEMIEGEEVLDLLGFFIFHYIGIYYSFLWDKEMLDLALWEVKAHLESLQILIQERSHYLDIRWLHRSESFYW